MCMIISCVFQAQYSNEFNSARYSYIPGVEIPQTVCLPCSLPLRPLWLYRGLIKCYQPSMELIVRGKARTSPVSQEMINIASGAGPLGGNLLLEPGGGTASKQFVVFMLSW